MSYMDSKGLKMWKKKEKKRVQDRYSEMDVCAQRLGLGKDFRVQFINDIKCATC